MELMHGACIMATMICNWSESMSITPKQTVENMCHVPFWLIQSPARWTVFGCHHTDNFSDQVNNILKCSASHMNSSISVFHHLKGIRMVDNLFVSLHFTLQITLFSVNLAPVCFYYTFYTAPCCILHRTLNLK